MEDRLYKTSQLFNIRQISFLYNEISIFESAARNSFEKSRKYRARKLEVEEGNLVKKKKKRNCFYIIRVYVLGYVVTILANVLIPLKKTVHDRKIELPLINWGED